MEVNKNTKTEIINKKQNNIQETINALSYGINIQADLIKCLNNINLIALEISNNQNIEEYKVYIKEIKDKVDEIKNNNIYINATIEHIQEKTDKIDKQNNDVANKINPIPNLNKINLIPNNINNLNLIPNLNNAIKYNYLNNNENNNINNPFFNFPNFFPLINNISSQFNNPLNNEEMNKLKEIPLKDREFFYKDEELSQGENEYIEFKDYTYPFSLEKINEIKRQYCGFLNSHGGRIYIGITDLRKVKGIELDYKTRDIIRNELINYTYDFYPKCRIDKINIYFKPVKSIQTKKYINNKYVIEIIVYPGEPFNLYSINNKVGFISTLRQPGQCINLTAEEIQEQLFKRKNLFNQKHTLNNENEDINKEKEDNDYSNNDVIDESFEDNEDSDDTTDSKKKVEYVAQITNIDTSLKIKDINRYFNGCKSSYQKFPANKGKSLGYGEIHFPKKEAAKLFKEEFNRINLCGKDKINVRIKKRIIKT